MKSRAFTNRFCDVHCAEGLEVSAECVETPVDNVLFALNFVLVVTTVMLPVE